MDKVVKTDAEWRAQLDDLAYKVTRRHSTERAFTHDNFPKGPGTYSCVCCGAPLFGEKSAELNLAAGNWQKLWLLLALTGVIPSRGWKRTRAQMRPMLLLWIPLLFYPLSVAYSGVPIYVPVWWPFSYYNVRYGVELLPAFAVFLALAAYFAAQKAEGPP